MQRSVVDFRSGRPFLASGFESPAKFQVSPGPLSAHKVSIWMQLCDILKNDKGNRAEQFLVLFSEPVE